MSDPPAPFLETARGLEVRLRVTPKAARNAIGDIVVDGQGRGALKVAVTAPADKGAANRAVIALLAREFRLRTSDMAVIRGLKHRDKIVFIRARDGRQDIAALKGALTK